MPLYNQPSDTLIYQENQTKYRAIKVKLVIMLRKERAARAALNHRQSTSYATVVQEWHRKVEKLESAQKRKTKEAKNREFFEKVFPELRKQREDKERINRVGSRIRSEADLEEIMDGLQEQEVTSAKCRTIFYVDMWLFIMVFFFFFFLQNDRGIEAFKTVSFSYY